MRASSLVSLVFALVSSLALGGSTRAAPAVDLLATCTPPTSAIQIGGPEIPPIPADFFFPGSDPFSGIVALSGDPLGLSADTDTIVRRPSGDPFARSDPPGGPVIIPIEILQLSLVSVTPIVVTPGPQLWDFRIDLSVTPQLPGQMQVTKTHANGGTFSSVLPVQARFTFTRISDLTQRVMDPLPPIVLETFGGPWVHELDPNLHLPSNPGTDFHPGIEEPIPGDPSSQTRVPMPGVDPGSAQHTVCAARQLQQIPSLGLWGMLAAGLAILATSLFAIRRGMLPGARV